MTSLHGEFDSDLPIEAVVNACGEAFNRLGWRFEQTAPDCVVSHPSGFGGHPPRIEAVLRGSAEGTEIEIIGEDSPENPLDELQLMIVLDKARDAIQDAIVRLDLSSPAPAPVAPPSPSLADADADPSPDREQGDGPERQLQPAMMRSELKTRVDGSGGAMTIQISDLMNQFGLPEFNAKSVDTMQALLLTAGLKANPPLAEMGPGDSVTLRPAGAGTISSGNGRPTTAPASYSRPANREASVDVPPATLMGSQEEEAAATPVPEPRTNRLAMTSLVLSLIWLFGVGSLLAILLGGVAHWQIDQSRGAERGRDIATVGVVLGVIGAIATIVAAIVKFGP